MARKTSKNRPMTIDDFIKLCKKHKIDMNAIIAAPEGQFIFEGFDIYGNGQVQKDGSIHYGDEDDQEYQQTFCVFTSKRPKYSVGY